jgi:hypothetical protein
MEALFAAYESAGTGRKVALPFKTDAAKPFDLWQRNLTNGVDAKTGAS